jgi:hypothetical protein
VSKCQIFDEQDTLTITEVEQASSNLLVTVNQPAVCRVRAGELVSGAEKTVASGTGLV